MSMTFGKQGQRKVKNNEPASVERNRKQGRVLVKIEVWIFEGARYGS